MSGDRVAVRKTYKLYVNGAFVRSESGRTESVGGENVVRGSRKDVRDAVIAARAAHEKWAGQTPSNRGLVLYRLAEMMEARATSLAEQLVLGGTVDAAGARREVDAAIDRAVWYAGWCDKFVALASARNPVSGPHFNFSTTEPTGVIGVIAPDEPALLGLVTAVLPTLVSGNAAGARREVDAAIDRAVWYAGWCDKFVALASARNPVSGPHFNFSTTEPTGVIGVIAPDEPALLGLVTAVLPTLVSGNAVIVVASERDPRTAVVFAECLATSDLPAGVCNVVTGTRAELGPALAGHMDVDGLHAFGAGHDAEVALGQLASESVTRTRFEDAPAAKAWFSASYDNLDRVLTFTEMKTIWHPAKI